jgi:hypothetical protein
VRHRSGEPSPALRAGGVLAQARRGAQGRSGHAAGRLADSVGVCTTRSTGTPHEAPRPEGLAVTLALRRRQSAGSDRAHFLPDHSPELAATAMPPISQHQARISAS